MFDIVLQVESPRNAVVECNARRSIDRPDLVFDVCKP